MEEERCTQRCGGETREGDNLVDLGIDGGIILKRGFKKQNGGLDVAQDRQKCRALVSTALNLRVP